MRSAKYYYNAHTCSYELSQRSPWDTGMNLLALLSFSTILAVGLLRSYTACFQAPLEAQLQQENTTLRQYYQKIQEDLQHGQEVLAHLQRNDDDLYRTILEKEPIPHTVRQAGAGGTNKYAHILDKERLIQRTLQKVDGLKRQMYIQSRSYDELQRVASQRRCMLAGFGFITKYAHLKSFAVRPGQRVNRGQCIGYVGMTGTATAPHLHYEVLKNKKNVNPAYYFFNDLNATEYEEMIAIAARSTHVPS